MAVGSGGDDLYSRFFFFQAEDGIRDLTVTGVQTCALPISARASTPSSGTAMRARSAIAPSNPLALVVFVTVAVSAQVPALAASGFDGAIASQIGRASCRERV